MSAPAASVTYTPPYVLPDRLTSLRGPSRGLVELPRHLMWNTSRPFDLSDDARLRSMLRIVLREARTQSDLVQFVDEASLRRLWKDIDLPQVIRDAWESRFPELQRDTPQP